MSHKNVVRNIEVMGCPILYVFTLYNKNAYFYPTGACFDRFAVKFLAFTGGLAWLSACDCPGTAICSGSPHLGFTYLTRSTLDNISVNKNSKYEKNILTHHARTGLEIIPRRCCNRINKLSNHRPGRFNRYHHHGSKCN